MVVGGIEAEQGRYRWIVSVKNDEMIHVCMGIFIHPEFILTAAHCLAKRNDTRLITKNSPVQIGAWNLNDGIGSHRAEDSSVKVLRASRTIVHPWYRNTTSGFDIALLKLPRDLNTAIIPRPTLALDQPQNYQSVYALGWGHDENGDMSDNLRISTNLQIVPNDVCIKKGVKTMGEDMLCAHSERENTCVGDAGGPLFIPANSDGNISAGNPEKDIIVGITSFGPGDCSKMDTPGVYTSISHFRPWIDGFTTQQVPTHSDAAFARDQGQLAGRAVFVTLGVVLISWLLWKLWGPWTNRRQYPYVGRDGKQQFVNLKQLIGVGNFAVVHEATVAGSSKKVAVKLYKSQKVTSNPVWEHELNILAKLPPHTNILEYLGHGSAGKDSFIVQELMEMDLGMLVSKERRASLTYLNLLEIFIGVSEGLEHLENNRLVHYDLKPEKILLLRENGRYVPRITGFALSKQRIRTYLTVEGKGTIGYIPQEVVNAILSGSHRVNMKKVDVFSFGRVMWVCVTGQSPGIPPLVDEDEENEDRGPYEQFPGELGVLVKACEHHDYRERPSWEDIIHRLKEMTSCTWAKDKIPQLTAARTV